METLIQLTRPTLVVQSNEPKELQQLPNARGTFARRRQILEDSHKKREHIEKTSPFITQVEIPRATVSDVTPQSVEALEKELGLVDEFGAEQNAS